MQRFVNGPLRCQTGSHLPLTVIALSHSRLSLSPLALVPSRYPHLATLHISTFDPPSVVTLYPSLDNNSPIGGAACRYQLTSTQSCICSQFPARGRCCSYFYWCRWWSVGLVLFLGGRQTCRHASSLLCLGVFFETTFPGQTPDLHGPPFLPVPGSRHCFYVLLSHSIYFDFWLCFLIFGSYGQRYMYHEWREKEHKWRSLSFLGEFFFWRLLAPSW